MTEQAGRISRRTIIAAAGGLAAASALGAEASINAGASTDETLTRIRRISLVAHDVASVSRDIQSFMGSTAERAPSQIQHAGVYSECFWAGDVLIEVSQPATHRGHLVGLEMPSPDILRNRAHAAGMRLFRDMTIHGRRLVQPDIGVQGVRLEASASLQAPVRIDRGVSVASLKIVADHPARNVRQIAALFGGLASDGAVNFGSRSLEFAVPQAGSSRTGLVEITLTAPRSIAQSARIAGIDWRILA